MQRLSKLDTIGASKYTGSTLDVNSTFNLATPVSPPLLADDPTSYDSNDEDEVLSSNEDEKAPSHRIRINVPMQEAFQKYSLPQEDSQDKKHNEASLEMSALKRESLLVGQNSTMPWDDGMDFLGCPIDTGLDDFVDELSLMADVIGNRCK